MMNESLYADCTQGSTETSPRPPFTSGTGIVNENSFHTLLKVLNSRSLQGNSPEPEKKKCTLLHAHK